MQAIVAVDSNWSIGFCDQLLFDLPKDRAQFKRLTTPGTLIYGSKTLKSFPGSKPLPGRKNIILSHNQDLVVPGATVVHSIDELKKTVDLSADDVFLIGGESVYRQLLPLCSHVIVTKVFACADAATATFPNLDFHPDWFSHDDNLNYEDNGYTCRTIYYQHI